MMYLDDAAQTFAIIPIELYHLDIATECHEH